MGKLQEFDITFTNNKVVYSPGESICGAVKIRTSHPLPFKGTSVSVTCWFREARGGMVDVNKLFHRDDGRGVGGGGVKKCGCRVVIRSPPPPLVRCVSPRVLLVPPEADGASPPLTPARSTTGGRWRCVGVRTHFLLLTCPPVGVSTNRTNCLGVSFEPIKVYCQGSCGISNKINDSSWMLEEQYFNSTLSVADKGTLVAGEHSFPFQFVIPVAAPTSFEGPFGRINYRVRAAIDTPRFSKDYKAQRPFYLLNLLNLNEVPDIEHPSYAVTTKKFNYLLVKTGTLMLKARSDLRGYIPGQVIKLATEIHNKSGKDTGCVLASLIQKVTYKTKRPMYDLRTIAEVEGAGVKAGKHAEWREQIIVPPLPQSALAGCSLIDIDYFIQVSLKSPDAVVTLPICIGNIALNLSPSRTMPSSPVHCGATVTAGVTPSAPPAEEELDERLCAGAVASEEIPTKSHSQQDPSGQPVTMSPSAFSHAPGAALPPSHRQPDATAPLFCVSTGATIPFFTEGNVTPIPTSCSLILPPEYSSWDYPHEPPPTYEESCSSANSSFNSRQ